MRKCEFFFTVRGASSACCLLPQGSASPGRTTSEVRLLHVTGESEVNVGW